MTRWRAPSWKNTSDGYITKAGASSAKKVTISRYPWEACRKRAWPLGPMKPAAEIAATMRQRLDPWQVLQGTVPGGRPDDRHRDRPRGEHEHVHADVAPAVPPRGEQRAQHEDQQPRERGVKGQEPERDRHPAGFPRVRREVQDVRRRLRGTWRRGSARIRPRRARGRSRPQTATPGIRRPAHRRRAPDAAPHGAPCASAPSGRPAA